MDSLILINHGIATWGRFTLREERELLATLPTDFGVYVNLLAAQRTVVAVLRISPTLVVL